ncbi:MAG: hypothetical protein HYT80_02860 [Euryarchaeota archaeon]|nr:hypothetical protein [Euryarchaeota archaeon]
MADPLPARPVWSDPLFRNGLFLVLATAANAGLGGLFWLVAARRLDPVGAGLAAAWIGATGVVALVGLLGLGSAFLRFLPDPPPNARARTADAVWLWTLGAVLVLGATTIFVGSVLEHPLAMHERSSQAWFLAACVGVALSAQAESILAAYRGGHAVFALTVGTGVARLTAVSFSDSYAQVFAAWAAPVVAAGLFAVPLMRRFQPGYVPLRGAPAALGKTFWRFALVHHASLTAYAASVLAMPAVVVANLGAAPGAHYFVAFAFATVVYIGPNALARSAVVEGSRTPERLRSILARTLTVSLLLGAAAAGVVVAFARPILGVFGPAYAREAPLALLVLAVATPFVTIRAVGEAFLLVQRRMADVFALNVVVAAAYMGASLIVLQNPAGSIEHVAAAWTGAHLVGALLLAFRLRRVRLAPSAPVALGASAEPAG